MFQDYKILRQENALSNDILYLTRCFSECESKKICDLLGISFFSFFFFLLKPAHTFYSCLEDKWAWEKWNYDTATVVLQDGRIALMHLCLGGFLFLPLPILVTWLLPVAGTTYKLVVIKVFDLLWFPVEVHTFPDWQTLCCCHCDQWVTMKREPQSDRVEIEHGEGSRMAEWKGKTEKCTGFALEC